MFRTRDVIAMLFEALLEKVGLRKPFPVSSSSVKLQKQADGSWTRLDS